MTATTKGEANRPTVFMFSGQGSQYFQMGQELYSKNQRFKLWMDLCDDIVAPLINTSLIAVLYESGNKNTAFDRVLYTTPALISVQYSLAQLLLEKSIRPDYLLGYSLGEFTAAILGGAMELEQGLRLSVAFSRCIENKVPEARMLAILDSVDVMQRHPEVFRDCVLTGENFNNNFVVSASPQRMMQLQTWLKQNGKQSELLDIKYGFHTPDMQLVEDDIKQLMKTVPMFSLQVPMLSSVTGEEIADTADEYLWNVLRQPVQFKMAVENLLKHGDPICIDLSPSGVLAALVKYIKPVDSDALLIECMNKFGRDVATLDKALSQLAQPVSHKP